ncbi:zinc finger protein 267-like isoform X2 [Uranotaenia lowii]|nr:zinc finger protein 267-like isoform X2 [Uranotaenia lowii]
MDLDQLLNRCRLCLKQHETYRIIFFDNFNEDEFYKILDLNLCQNDRLSNLICDSCYDLVERFQIFKISAGRNQAYLIALLEADYKKPVSGPINKLEPTQIDEVCIEIRSDSDSEDTCDANVQQPVALLPTITQDITHDLESPVIRSANQQVSPEDDRDSLIEVLDSQHDDDPQEETETHSVRQALSTPSEQDSSSQGPYKCKTCNKEFQLEYNLIRHTKLHTEKKPLCKICNKLISRRYFTEHLQKHVKAMKHNGTGMLKGIKKVPQQRRFPMSARTIKLEPGNPSSAQVVAPALRIVRRQPPGQHVCEICKKIMPTAHSLKRHTYIHKHAKPVCKICHKQISIRYFTEHLKRHLSKGDKYCEVCGKKFVNERCLEKHRLKHDNDK